MKTRNPMNTVKSSFNATDSPEPSLDSAQEQKLSFSYKHGLHEYLQNRVLGQSAATDIVADAVERAMFGYHRPGAPIANFMFLGSTGVGKTETAVGVAEFLWGGNHEDHFIRLDMAEYQHPDSNLVLLGRNRDEQGYLGEEIDRVNANGGGILLFDELEKAHMSVIKILLALLDVGRVTMTNGVTKSVDNFIVVMTSNLGTSELSEMRNTSQKGIMDMLQNVGQDKLSPEFFARIDNYLVFDMLSPEVQKKICGLLLNSEVKFLKKKLFEKDGIERKFIVHEEAKSLILENGYTPKLGARPLKKAVQRELGYAYAAHLKRYVGREPIAGDLILERTSSNKIELFYADNKEANESIKSARYAPTVTMIRA